MVGADSPGITPGMHCHHRFTQRGSQMRRTTVHADDERRLPDQPDELLDRSLVEQVHTVRRESDGRVRPPADHHHLPGRQNGCKSCVFAQASTTCRFPGRRDAGEYSCFRAAAPSPEVHREAAGTGANRRMTRKEHRRLPLGSGHSGQGSDQPRAARLTGRRRPHRKTSARPRGHRRVPAKRAGPGYPADQSRAQQTLVVQRQVGTKTCDPLPQPTAEPWQTAPTVEILPREDDYLVNDRVAAQQR